MSAYTPTFTVVQDGPSIDIFRDDQLLESIAPQEAAELAAMLTRAVELYWQQYEDDAADMAAEAAALNEAEDAGIRRRETELEMEFDRLGYNDMPD